MASSSFIDLAGLTHYDEKLNEKLETKYVDMTGNQTVGGVKTFSSEIKSTAANSFRLKNGNYGVFLRNDSSAFYILVTASGDADGNWTSARPLTINLSNGVCSINGTAASATTAAKATGDSNGRNISTGYMWRGSYERIEGTSSAHKDLNDYRTAGFYNIKTVNVDNCPAGIGIDAVLLNYPWNQGNYLTQEITESAASSDTRRWIRKLNVSTWSAWKEVEMDIGTVTNA